MEIYKRIPLTRELALDEAVEHVRSPLPASAIYPFTLEAVAERAKAARASKPSGVPPSSLRSGQSTTATSASPATGSSSGSRPLTGGNQSRLAAIGDEDPEKERSRGRGRKRKGRQSPVDSDAFRKYGKSSSSIPCLDREIDKFLEKSPGFRNSKGNLGSNFKLLLKSSLAKKTWSKYRSAWNKWKQFASDTKLGDPERFTPELGLTFTCWCKARKNLKASTVSRYLASLQKLNSLTHSFETGRKGGLQQVSGTVFLQKILLKGLKNLEKGNSQEKKVTAMDLKTLQQIRKGLLKGGWKKVTRTSVWAACLKAFWGSFRLSEILPPSATRFDKIFGFTVEGFRFQSQPDKNPS